LLGVALASLNPRYALLSPSKTTGQFLPILVFALTLIVGVFVPWRLLARRAKPSTASSGGDTDATTPQMLETRILRGSIWMGLGFGSRQIVSWLSMLLLARLLDPDAFGLTALALTVISAVEYLRGAGVWAAIVHRRSEVEEAAASALVYWVVSSLAIYGVCFVIAPYVASLFHAPELADVLRVLAVITIFGAISGVPAAILERELAYARTAQVDIAAIVAQVATTISLAFLGAGVWSLVAGQIAAHAVESAALWYFVPWRPSPRKASWSMLRELSRYARPAGVWSFATFFNGIVDTVTVGRILGATAVGFYSVAFRLATSVDSVLNNVILRAMFPAFAIVHEDSELFRKTLLRHMQRMVLTVLPVSIFLVLAARPIVLVLLGDKWESIITPVRILAMAGLVSSLSATASSVFRGAGRPELAMRYVVMNAVLLVPALIVLTKAFEFEGAATAVFACLTATTIPALRRMLRLVGVSIGDLAQTIRPGLVCCGALTAVLAVLVPATGAARPFVSLIVLVTGGIAAYLISTALFARSVVVPMWLDLRGTRT
jgi:PST family polysaccharide transporter